MSSPLSLVVQQRCRDTAFRHPRLLRGMCFKYLAVQYLEDKSR